MIGKRIIQLRKERGWTQQQIADKINISRSAYAGYEIDRRVPEYATLEKLADIFECSMDYLTGREQVTISTMSEGWTEKNKRLFAIAEFIEELSKKHDIKDLDSIEDRLRLAYEFIEASRKIKKD